MLHKLVNTSALRLESQLENSHGTEAQQDENKNLDFRLQLDLPQHVNWQKLSSVSDTIARLSEEMTYRV